MFGFFSKSDLTAPEAALLLLTLLQAHLTAHVIYGQDLLSSDDCSTVIKNWLSRNNRKAGLGYRAKVSSTSVALFLTIRKVQTDETISPGRLLELLEDAQKSPDGIAPGSVVGKLLGLCDSFVADRKLA